MAKKQGAFFHKELLVYLLFAALCFLVSVFILPNDLYFHTDIARDLLLIEDIVVNKNLTLIGPRTGGIQGIFHGPLWLYLNLPAFVLGNGDPLFISYFWSALYALYCAVFFYITAKNISLLYSLLAGVINMLIFLPLSKNLFNPFGAVMLSLPFFVSLERYISKNSIKYLFFSVLTVGIMFQFQMAMAGPLILLTMAIVFYAVFRTKKYFHLFAFLLLLLPLSSFIVFDLRNNFLQVKSLVSFVQGDSGNPGLSLLQIFSDRLGSAFDSILQITDGNIMAGILFLGGFVLSSIAIIKNRIYLQLFWLIFGGYWILTIFFGGKIWGYYYLPFVPIILFVFFRNIQTQSKKYLVIALLLLVVNFIKVSIFYKGGKEFIGKSTASWQFYNQMAGKIYKNNEDFGYFTFKEDQYAYEPKYAVQYNQKKYQSKSYAFEKKPVTFLILGPDGENPFISQNYWRQNQVNINKEPSTIEKYANGYLVEEYLLSDEEIKISPDPNLINNLHFR